MKTKSMEPQRISITLIMPTYMTWKKKKNKRKERKEKKKKLRNGTEKFPKLLKR